MAWWSSYIRLERRLMTIPRNEPPRKQSASNTRISTTTMAAISSQPLLRSLCCWLLNNGIALSRTGVCAALDQFTIFECDLLHAQLGKDRFGRPVSRALIHYLLCAESRSHRLNQGVRVSRAFIQRGTGIGPNNKEHNCAGGRPSSTFRCRCSRLCRWTLAQGHDLKTGIG